MERGGDGTNWKSICVFHIYPAWPYIPSLGIAKLKAQVLILRWESRASLVEISRPSSNAWVSHKHPDLLLRGAKGGDWFWALTVSSKSLQGCEDHFQILRQVQGPSPSVEGKEAEVSPAIRVSGLAGWGWGAPLRLYRPVFPQVNPHIL